MRILFLSQRFLLPMDTGGKIRTGNILEQLSKHDEITLVCNVESPKDDRYVAEMPRFCRRFVPVPWREIPRRSVGFFVRLFFQMFSPHPVTALNDYSRDLRAAVEHEVSSRQYDLAICDFVQSALMFQQVAGVPSVLFQHNVESMIAGRHKDRAGNVITRLFWWLQWKKMSRYEAAQCRRFDTVIAVSEADRDGFQNGYGLDNVSVIPTGVDIDFFKPPAQPREKANTLVFCGSMDWLPNEDAINYFMADVLPLIRREIPEVRLTVVGRNPSAAMLKAAEGNPHLELTGWVEDTRPYLEQGAVAIVPIRIGGGTRMKIYEAMAMGKAVVSTRIGAEGLAYTHGTNIAIEDDPAGFASAVVRLLKNSQERLEVGAAARDYVESNFGWSRVAEVFRGICADTVSRGSADGRSPN
jgi:polysaccharide biosynthesis protein PslH